VIHRDNFVIDSLSRSHRNDIADSIASESRLNDPPAAIDESPGRALPENSEPFQRPPNDFTFSKVCIQSIPQKKRVKPEPARNRRWTGPWKPQECRRRTERFHGGFCVKFRAYFPLTKFLKFLILPQLLREIKKERKIFEKTEGNNSVGHRRSGSGRFPSGFSY
jgi:hypothetical protein